MKQVIERGRRGLAVYFMLLPLLFGLHASQHQHEDSSHHQELVVSEYEADYDLCDLYLSQSAATTYSILTLVGFNHTYQTLELRSSEQFVAYCNEQRGPPVQLL
ncbi:MAG: hypothetical protein AAFX87_18180 [Bacteroidota bacterium]